jgi:tryptophan synthase alpha chain
MLPRIRQHVHIPVGVGFGIRDATTARAVSRVADAVVIGSRIIQLLEAAPEGQAVQAAHDFLVSIRQALDA